MTLIIFFAVLAVLIITHEFGHFIFAKLSKIKVEEFGFGFPPRIFGFQILKGQTLKKIAEEKSLEIEVDTTEIGDEAELVQETITEKIREIDVSTPVKKRRFFWLGRSAPVSLEDKNLEGGTIYSVNLIPFGGFVRIFGEEGEENKDKMSFGAQRLYIRALILIAGILFNLVLAWPFFSATYIIGVPMSVEQSAMAGGTLAGKGVMVIEVQKDTPAEKAGLKSADFLLRFTSGSEVLEVSDIKGVQDFIAGHAGKEIKIDYSRNEKEISTRAVPSIKPENGKASLGIAMDEVGIVKLPFYKAIWQGLVSTVRLTGLTAKALAVFFVDIFTTRTMLSQVAGPVGIAGLVGSAAQSGFVFILQLVALLSINLALINFIPFPALDGGRLLFLAVEFIRGKPISQKTANIANNIGFTILIFLMLAITYQDISRLFR